MYNQIQVILNNLCLSFKLAMRNLPIFSSPDHNLSVVRRRRKLCTFSSSPEPLGNFNQALYKAPLGEVDSSLLK